VSVIPSNIKAGWGYTVNFKVNSVQTFLSDHSTEGNPVAGIVMQMQLDVISLLKQEHISQVYEFLGDSPRAVAISP
jgi:hypothetical protein